MAKNDQPESNVPEEEKAFAELLKKWGIGLKTPSAETIAENISRTGGSFVFETPETLAERLATWHEYISPTKRKQVLEQWFAEKEIAVSPEALKAVTVKSEDVIKKQEEEKKKAEEEEKKKSKFFVETETGLIRGAKQGEVSMTWDEAEKVADRIKKELKKSEDEKKKGKFTIDEDGNLKIAEGATLSAEDVAVMNLVAKAQEGGDKRSAFEILEDKIKEFKSLQDLTGGGKGKGGLAEDVETYERIKKLLGTDEETKKILGAIGVSLDKLSDRGGGSEEVKALTKQVQDLTKKIEDNEKQVLRDQITNVNNELVSVRAELKKGLEDARSKDEYGIMSEGLKTIDKRFSSLESLVLQIFGKSPPPIKEEETQEMKAAIGAEAGKTAEVRKLGESLFIEHA